MYWLCFCLILVCCQLAATKKVYEEYDDDDFIPLTGERFDRFDWMLCEALDEREPGNVIASPVSVKLLLSILYEAATGETAKELQQVLQLQTSRAVTRVHNSALLKTLQAPNANYSLDIGIRLYLDSRLHPKNWYKTVLAHYYGAYIKPLDFHDPVHAADEINHWVNYATHGHIQNLIPNAHSLTDSVLMLISAVYFQGQWKHPFSVANSYGGTFFSPDGPQPTKYMTQTDIFYYSESEELDAQFLRLPYKGRKFSMYIVLPRRLNGLNQTLANIRPFILRREMWALEETSVAVTLPVFKFEFTMNLKKTLINMGITTIFTNLHELKGMMGSKGKHFDPVVSNIMQKATIEVNERGTIAAGATEVKFTNKMGFPEVEFNASHPFLFFIEDEVTGTVIFEGKFVYPKVLTADLDVNPQGPPQPPPPPESDVDVQVSESNGDSELDRFVNTPHQPFIPEHVTLVPEDEPELPEKALKGVLDGTPWELSKSP